jgi:hypothetical protein
LQIQLIKNKNDLRRIVELPYWLALHNLGVKLLRRYRVYEMPI